MAEIREADLAHLESLWEAGLGQAYDFYRPGVEPRVALAAALVETAVGLQGLGGPAAAAGELLIGDLCLARASRLLADTGSQPLQVAFARAVERVSAEASGDRPLTPVRDLLGAAIGIAR